jgi:hypothetical protein
MYGGKLQKNCAVKFMRDKTAGSNVEIQKIVGSSFKGNR